MPSDFPPVYIASHRRSGTHLTLDSLANNFSELSKGFGNLDWEDQSQADFPFFKTHAHALHAQKRISQPCKVIYVVRDCRDVMVSLYYYAKGCDKSLDDVSFPDFLEMKNPYDKDTYDQPMNRIEYWSFHVNSWIDQTTFDCLFVAYDDWKTEFNQTIHKVAEFLEVPPNSNLRNMVMSRPETLLDKILRKTGLSRRTQIGFRGGKSGGWKDYFEEQTLDLVREQAGETYRKLSETLMKEYPL
jgi:hypothetical protein